MGITKADVLYVLIAFVILNLLYFGFLKGAIAKMTEKVEEFTQKMRKKHRSFIRKRKMKRFSKQARREIRKLLRKFNLNFK